jgi:hypothetical protein
MKKLFFLLTILVSLAGHSQTCDSCKLFALIVNGTSGGSSGGGTTPVVEQTLQLSFIDQFTSETTSPGWQAIKDLSGTTVSSGNYTLSALKDASGATTSVAFNLFEAGVGGVTGTPIPSPASNVIFGDFIVVGKAWNLGYTQEASFRLTGLVAGRTYRVWILSNDDAYRNNVIAFKCNGSDMKQYGTTATLINNSNNYGTASDQLTSSVAKLFYVQVAANGSGQLTFDPDWVSGSAGNERLVINAMVVQRMNF